MGALFTDTLRALAAPRRLMPMLLIVVPMLAAQHELSSGRPQALPLALLLVAVFLLVGPFAFRALFPAVTSGPGRWPLAARVLFYGAVGGLAPLIAWVLPEVLGIGQTFISKGPNLLVTTGLFWVGGFGLGRDIEFERRWLEERRRAQRLSEEAERAQLLALRAHLDPHFLFNTLNAIAEWCREDAEVAERAILQLSSILRELLDGVKTASWPLSREIALARDLFELHRIRDPRRFTVEIDGDGAGVQVPPLLLVPLAENAMKHGPGAGHRGPVKLSAARDGAITRVTIANPGAFERRRAGGEGLAMVEKRLELCYHGRAHLSLRAVDGRTEVALELPERPEMPG